MAPEYVDEFEEAYKIDVVIPGVCVQRFGSCSIPAFLCFSSNGGEQPLLPTTLVLFEPREPS